MNVPYPGSLISGSDSSLSSNGSSPAPAVRNGNAASLAPGSTVMLPPMHPRRAPNHNNHNNYGMRGNYNDSGIYDQDLNFIYGSSSSSSSSGSLGGGNGRPQAVLDAIRGSPSTWNHTELVQTILQNNDMLIAWMKEVGNRKTHMSCS